MFELILFFLCGYFLSSHQQSKFQADLRKPDKILTWDTKLLAWRPVYDKTKMQTGRTYLLAYEVLKED
jgi:hypothetical protein